MALLRGINVGRHKRIAMADLRALLGGLGYTDVATLLQSGNAVFASGGRKPDTLARDIEAAITRELGMSVSCVVRGAVALKAVVESNPLGTVASDGSKYLVHFLSAAPDPALLDAIDPAEHLPEEFRLVGSEIYLWCPSGVLASTLSPLIGDLLPGIVSTARNWNTVTKLLALAEKGRD